MKSFLRLFVALCGAIIVGFQSTDAFGETTSERILRSNVLRAGYLVYPPGAIKDPNTNKLTGVHVEALEMVAKNLGFKLEWVEASGWGGMITDLGENKFDVMGSPVWANATRAKRAAFSAPLFWSGICAFVRADDGRFAKGLTGVDWATIKIATIDGEMSDIIAQSDFPVAKRVSLPQSADNSLMLLNVAERHADITFVEPYIAELFLKEHPGALKNVTPQDPLRVFPNCWMLPQGDVVLKEMIDTALAELVNSGQIDRLLAKHAGKTSLFFPVARPYRATEARAP